MTAVTWAFVLLWADGITAAFHAFSQGTAAVEESVFVTLHTVAFVILVTGLTTTLLVFGFSERRSLPLIAALPLAVILCWVGAAVTAPDVFLEEERILESQDLKYSTWNLIKYNATHPRFALVNTVNKIHHLLLTDEMVVDPLFLYAGTRFSQWTRWVFWLFVMIGAFGYWKSGRPVQLVGLGVVVFGMLSTLLIFGNPRFRVPFQAMACFLFADGCRMLWRQALRGQTGARVRDAASSHALAG